MKSNIKCYICVFCQTCDKEQEEKCKQNNYMLLTTKQDKELCDLMCGEPQNEN